MVKINRVPFRIVGVMGKKGGTSRQEAKDVDISQTMQYTGMGRGMYKMAKRLGVLKDRPQPNDTA